MFCLHFQWDPNVQIPALRSRESTSVALRCLLTFTLPLPPGVAEKVTVSERSPTAVGVNTMRTAQLALAASVVVLEKQSQVRGLGGEFGAARCHSNRAARLLAAVRNGKGRHAAR